MATNPNQRPQARAHAADLRRLIPFEKPQSSPWVVPLPAGAVSQLLLGFRGSSIHRSWTGYALADITIKIPRGGDGEPDPRGDGAKMIKITYEACLKVGL